MNWRKCNVVMLPANHVWNKDYSPTNMITCNGELFTNGKIIAKLIDNDGAMREQHLYITTDDKICEGDWQITNDVLSIRTDSYHEDDRKIIATTDPELTVDYKGYEHRTGREINAKVYLPHLQQSFIKEYVADPNGKWEVEYETAGNWIQERTSERIGQRCIICNEYGYRKSQKCECGFKLKINQDSTINITPIEEKMYSREEIINAWESGESFGNNNGGKRKECWIKENL